MDNNYNYTGFPATYTPNLYYQPTITRPIGNPNWTQQYNTTAIPSYQQQLQMQQQQQNVQSVNNNSMIWVQGEAGAKAYVLPPNTTLPLWDSEDQVIYIKSVDGSGKPTMTILDYVDRNAQKQSDEVGEVIYATKEQIDTLNSKLTSLSNKFDGLNDYVTREQFDSVSDCIDNLASQIDSINNKITTIGKSQSNSNNNRRSGK